MINRCPRDKYDQQHPTCRSCEAKTGPCTKGRKRRAKAHDVTVKTWHEGTTLHTTLFVHGLNRWNNKERSNYRAVRKAWSQVLAGTVFLWGKGTGKRLLTVHRIVTSKAHLIKDDDNLQGCLKPIKDVLQRQEKVLIEDSREFLQTDIIQTVGDRQVAIITVTDLKGDDA